MRAIPHKRSAEDFSEQIILLVLDYSIGTTVVITSKFTTEDIDNLEKIILSCSKIDTPDAAINLIIIEEMPAYFLGQKDLASVVKILQDRIQKVLDERG